MSNITLYPHIGITKDGEHITINTFLEDIASGRWQDEVLAVRTNRRSKDTLPYVTISGMFQERKTAGLLKHSGYICIDIDKKHNPHFHAAEFKQVLGADPYIFAAFLSASGHGLACIIPIVPNKHQESFDGLQEYFYTSYKIVIDQVCRDVTRPRFVSWDTQVLHNPDAQVWKRYPPKAPKKPHAPAIFVQDDFVVVLQEIQAKQVDIAPTYHDWLRLGFILAERFGEAGEPYFHTISQYHPGYQEDTTSRQYRACCNRTPSAQPVTWGTFNYLCKQAGIQSMSTATVRAAQTASFAMKSRQDPGTTAVKIAESHSIPLDQAASIVDQVFKGGVMVTQDSEVELIEHWLEDNYLLRRNAFTQEVEFNNERLTDTHLRTIWRAGLRVFPDLSYDALRRIILSDYAPSFDPFQEFFNDHAAQGGGEDYVTEFIACIETDTGMQDGEFFPQYADLFIKKWLVGIIAACHGEHSPLMLVLTGPQNTGKTEWFRRLLPQQLRRYMVQSKMDRGKDDEILMTKNLLIIDDEMSGKSKKEEKMMKEFLSAQYITLRRPYDSTEVTLPRHAVFGGTTNELEVLNDPTGNRRIIPVNVLGIDFERIDKFDRNKLFMSLYNMWLSGYDRRLSRDEIRILNGNSSSFKVKTAEMELVLARFRLADPGEIGAYYTISEVWEILQHGGARLSREQVRRALLELKWKSVQKKISGENQRRFYLVRNPTIGN